MNRITDTTYKYVGLYHRILFLILYILLKVGVHHLKYSEVTSKMTGSNLLKKVELDTVDYLKLTRCKENTSSPQ